MKTAKALGLLALVIVSIPLAVAAHGYWTYKKLERSVVDKMDQYYLAITQSGREEYLLGDDEQFEVPYMASTLSVSAEPTRIYDLNGRLIGQFASEKGLYVRSAEDLPVFLKKALVASEDSEFYEHHGIHYAAIARAVLVNLRNMRKSQGGSTLTQQLAKILFTTRRKTYGRKIFELLCARKLETKFTKDQILLMYLNYVYFGHGAFGVESASRFYFGKPARDLELAEAALLVGLLPNPHRYSPYDSPELARARHRTVLNRMAKKTYIPAVAVERYWGDFWRAMDERLKAPETSFWRMSVNESSYVVETVRRSLEKDFSKERVLKGGLKVWTTFDLDVQRPAQAALTGFLREQNRLSTGAVRLEGGLAAVRASDGAILALVGGSGYHFGNQLNRAVDIKRPMGSSVKPFIFAWAFETGRGPRDKMLDAPIQYKIAAGKRWKPQNYGNKYYGEVTLEEALRRSLNSVAIKLLQSLDIDAVRSLLSGATGAPLDSFPRNLSLALGTADVSPLQAAAAYAVFVNGGRPVRPYFIRRIEDRSGSVLREAVAAMEPPLLSASACSATVAVMEGVLKGDGTAYGAAIKTGFTLPAAGKTGTTNDYRDAWFTGVTPDLAASVWIGHDDMRVALADKGTGGGLAAPVWMNFIKGVYRSRPTRPFQGAAENKVESLP
jgi:penicillin-binding protein 1A